MAGSAPIRVVVLYVHPLLGEGLARLLAAEPDVVTCAISSEDALGMAAALRLAPDAVIVERRERGAPMALPGDVTVPLLLFVDIAGAIGTVGAAHETCADVIQPGTDDLERVVRALRDLRAPRIELVNV
jgi:DNA-binding NarL/FixJ family response regulator